jgi:hypothetical protein
MLAIIIPYFKLTYFKATLVSLANQRDKRFKVYIGDDASPEDCSKLLKQFEGKFDFEYHRFETNLGGINLTQQWDRCIELSNDEKWLMILGDDDVLGENVVEKFYQYLAEVAKNESNVIRFACEVINKHGMSYLGPYFHPKLELASDFYCRKVKNLTRSSLSEYIFKKAVYEKHKFISYPLAWHSDDKAWIDFSENKPIFTINSTFVYVRFSEINISGLQDNIDLKLEASFQFFKDISKMIKTQFNKTQLLQLLMSFEVLIKNHRKIRYNEWLFLFKYYLFYFRIIPFLKFVRRFLISFFNK